MVEVLIVVAIALALAAGFWFTRGVKAGQGAAESAVLDQKARELDDAFREHPPQDY